MSKTKKTVDASVNMDLVLRALLYASLRGLPTADQIDVLSMAGWTNQQVGQATGLTANAVQKRLQSKKPKEE